MVALNTSFRPPSPREKVEFHHYKSDPYGKVTILEPDGVTARTESAYGNPWTFTGRRLDQETGLMYYRLRMYDAELGRFSERDPLGYPGVGNTPPEMPLKRPFASENFEAVLPHDLSAPEELSLYSLVDGQPNKGLDPSGGCGGGKASVQGAPGPAGGPGVCNCFNRWQINSFGQSWGGGFIPKDDNRAALGPNDVVNVIGNQSLYVAFPKTVTLPESFRVLRAVTGNTPDCVCLDVLSVEIVVTAPDGIEAARGGVLGKDGPSQGPVNGVVGLPVFHTAGKDAKGRSKPAALKSGTYKVTLEIGYIDQKTGMNRLEKCPGNPIKTQ